MVKKTQKKGEKALFTHNKKKYTTYNCGIDLKYYRIKIFNENMVKVQLNTMHNNDNWDTLFN